MIARRRAERREGRAAQRRGELRVLLDEGALHLLEQSQLLFRERHRTSPGRSRSCRPGYGQSRQGSGSAVAGIRKFVIEPSRSRAQPASPRQQVQLGRQRPELGPLGDGALEVDAAPSVAPGSMSTSEPGTRSAKTRTPCTEATSKPASASRPRASSSVNRRPGARRRRRGRRASPGLVEVAGHRPGDHRGVPLARRAGSEVAAGPQHLADRGQAAPPGRRRPRARRGRAPRRPRRRRRPRAAWTGRPAARSPRRRSRAARRDERGERVRARVDHRDPVAALGEPDREAAGAAADVEHVRRRRRGPAAARPRPRTLRAALRRSLGRSLVMATTLGLTRSTRRTPGGRRVGRGARSAGAHREDPVGRGVRDQPERPLDDREEPVGVANQVVGLALGHRAPGAGLGGSPLAGTARRRTAPTR